MEDIILYARYGRYPSGIRCYKRKLQGEVIIKKANHYTITFSEQQKNRFEDFIERIRNQTKHLISYSFYLINQNKWFEFKLIEQHADDNRTFTFEIYNEDLIIPISCLEL